jgi:hypothetical protein
VSTSSLFKQLVSDAVTKPVVAKWVPLLGQRSLSPIFIGLSYCERLPESPAGWRWSPRSSVSTRQSCFRSHRRLLGRPTAVSLSLVRFLRPCGSLCCAVLCCAVLCCAVLCCAVLCCAVLCYAVLCYAVLFCAVLGCAVRLVFIPV